ncbi:SGNH/GDSL hydrolase family protein [Bacteroides sp.]
MNRLLKILSIVLWMWVTGSYTVAAQKLKYYNADDFPLIGKMSDATEGRYARLPLSCKGVSEKWVWILGQDTPGLAVRFATNSTSIGAKWTNGRNNSMPHMTLVGVKGLDLYVLKNGKWRYVRCAKPKGKENETVIISNLERQMNEYMLYLPLYDGVTALEIGVDEDAVIEQPQVKLPITERPVICYGTSITQGGCASRPGMVYTSILSRMLNKEVVNLGFSGHGHLEYEIAELMTLRNPSLIIMDFIPNVSAAMLRERISKFMNIIEEKLPNVPVLFIEHVPFPLAEFDHKKGIWVAESNEALREAYQNLKKKGYKNLHYLKSDHLIGEDGESTVDGEHFTDLGFYRFAEELYPVVKKLIRK